MTYASTRVARQPAPNMLPRRPVVGSTVEMPPLVLADGNFVTTATLTNRTCKWPIGDPDTAAFHYCGQPPQSGRPYCGAHEVKGYQGTRRRVS